MRRIGYVACHAGDVNQLSQQNLALASCDRVNPGGHGHHGLPKRGLVAT